MRFTMIALGVALAAAPLSAQAPDSASIKLRQRIDAILGIPQKADQARRAGIPDTSLRGILEVLRSKRIPAEEASAILVTETEAVREHGPTDNFGAFVQAQLDAGKRGQELAAAIRAEHQARGQGQAKGAAGAARGRGGDDKADEAKKGGRPEGAGAQGRRPDDAMSKGARPDADSTRGKKPTKGAKRPF